MTIKTRRVPRILPDDNVIVSEDELRQRRPIAVYRAAKLVTGLGEFLCVIKSISSRTIVAETHARLALGDRVRIELGHDLVTAAVTSTDAGTIGLLFDELLDVQSWLSADGAQHRRTAPRVAIDARARIQIGNQLLFVKARNISQEGMGIETQDILMEGDELMIALRGWQGPIAGTIVRVDGDFAGIRFLQPLGFRALSEWLGSSGSVRPPLAGDAFERLAP